MAFVSSLARFGAALSLSAVAGTVLTPVSQAAPPTPGYHLSATWKLTGDGGWDYLNLDSKAHRLYIARGTRIQVLDSETGVLVGEVPGINGAHGVALDQKIGRGFATSGRDNQVVVFDLKTLAPVGKSITVGDRPDAIAFEPTTGHIFAFNAGGNSTSVIDPKTNAVLQTIPLGGNPEFGVADGKGNIFVNIENTSENVKIDAKTYKVVSRTALAPGEGPTGLAYDAKDGRLFSGCDNNLMVAIDAATGKVLADVPIGSGVDAAAFDPKLDLAFSSNGEGSITIVNAGGAVPTLKGTLPTHVGARTMTIDTKTGALFTLAADYEPAAAPAAGERPRRPKMIPGTAMVLKFERDH